MQPSRDEIIARAVDVLGSSGVSASARVVGLHLLRLCQVASHGRASAALEMGTVQAATGLGRSAAYKALGELERLGLMRRHTTRGHDGVPVRTVEIDVSEVRQAYPTGTTAAATLRLVDVRSAHADPPRTPSTTVDAVHPGGLSPPQWTPSTAGALGIVRAERTKTQDKNSSCSSSDEQRQEAQNQPAARASTDASVDPVHDAKVRELRERGRLSARDAERIAARASDLEQIRDAIDSADKLDREGKLRSRGGYIAKFIADGYSLYAGVERERARAARKASGSATSAPAASRPAEAFTPGPASPAAQAAWESIRRAMAPADWSKYIEHQVRLELVGEQLIARTPGGYAGEVIGTRFGSVLAEAVRAAGAAFGGVR